MHFRPTLRAGSSPLSRGILWLVTAICRKQRIIPALAGNTPPKTPLDRPTQDHPRSRGEYSLPTTRQYLIVGSSPLSRGIQALPSVRQSQVGIIPALAGNTGIVYKIAGSDKDHPRSRGEYYNQRVEEFSTKGSSPLSRGIRDTYDYHAVRLGIIPALAGNTCSTGAGAV